MCVSRTTWKPYGSLDMEEARILQAVAELEKWESRRKRVRQRIEQGEGDASEMERVEEQITHYERLLADMKRESLGGSDISRTIARTGNP